MQESSLWLLNDAKCEPLFVVMYVPCRKQTNPVVVRNAVKDMGWRKG